MLCHTSEVPAHVQRNISVPFPAVQVSGDKEQFKRMDENYVKRSELETEMMRERHEKEMETLKAELEANLKELQDIQVIFGISYSADIR